MELIYESNWHKIKNDIYTVGTSNKNEFIPLYTLLESKRLSGYNPDSSNFSEHIVNNIFMYHKPIFSDGISFSEFEFCRTMPNLLSVFVSYDRNGIYRFKLGEDYIYVNVGGGYLMDTAGNILLMLCCKSPEIIQGVSDAVLSTSHVKVDRQYLPEKLRLMVSTELIRNVQYKNFYKRIEKEILQSMYDMKIDVIFSTSEKIEQSLFKNDFEVSFNTLEELNETLNSGIGNILFQPETETIPVEVNPITEINPIIDSSTEGIQANVRWSLTNTDYTMGFDPISSDSQSNFVIQGGREIIQNFHNVIEQTRENFLNGNELENLWGTVEESIPDIVQQIEDVEQPTDEQVNGNQEDELPF